MHLCSLSTYYKYISRIMFVSIVPQCWLGENEKFMNAMAEIVHLYANPVTTFESFRRTLKCVILLVVTYSVTYVALRTQQLLRMAWLWFIIQIS